MDLTVAICSYRRIGLLEATLRSMCDCDSIGTSWELLVVDNGCDPAVETLVETFRSRLPVQYVPEPALGTSHARNRAVAQASAPIVLFTDDDVTFERQWLARMWQAIQQQSDCAFWGGRVEPVWPFAPPPWFSPGHCPMLGDMVVRYQRGQQPRVWDAETDPPFYTANLALRVTAMRQVGGFDTSVGHRGGRRMGMEDSLMVKAIAKQGGCGWYAADAVVYHPVPAERVTRRYAREFAWRQGWLSAELHRQGNRPPRWFFRAAAEQLARGLGQWAGSAIRFSPASAFAGQVESVFGASKLWHALRTDNNRES
jgi:glycosyltransferase involved in cell wall biosynthesis